MSTPNEFPKELLAAYADGELDAEATVAVERWLVEHPEALESLNTQRAFGPANAALWAHAEVPEPSAASWDATKQGIEAGLNKPSPRSTGRSWLLVGAATAAIAASVAWFAFGPVVPQQPVEGLVTPLVALRPATPEIAPEPRVVVRMEKPDPLAAYAVLEMATDDDVILDRVPDTRSGWLPTGRHPLPDTLVLATVDEVNLPEVDLSTVWPLSVAKMHTPPGHAPMIFAANRK